MFLLAEGIDRKDETANIMQRAKITNACLNIPTVIRQIDWSFPRLNGNPSHGNVSKDLLKCCVQPEQDTSAAVDRPTI